MDLNTVLWIGIGIGLILVIGVVVGIRARKNSLVAKKSKSLPTKSVDEASRDDSVADSTATESEPDIGSPAEDETPKVEIPERAGTRLARLRRRLASSNNAFATALAELLSRDRVDEETWDDFETMLITSDLGVETATKLIETLRKELAIDGIADPEKAKEVLKSELIRITRPELDRKLNLDSGEGKPAVIMVVGVNGTGKTTTIGKLARMLVAEGKTVLLGAADTFRAAAAEQLATWGERVGVQSVRGDEGSDPASVAFEAVKQGIDQGVDVVIIDTAGRLHTKTGLMDELGKVKRVIEKQADVGEVLLVLDATTGQNGLTQAKVFAEVVDVTGIVLTKLDGSAKGGIVIQVQEKLDVPVKFIGLGEGVDDLAPFEAEQFVRGLLDE